MFAKPRSRPALFAAAAFLCCLGLPLVSEAKELTYAWEREGDSFAILDLYAPEPVIGCTKALREAAETAEVVCAKVQKRGATQAKESWTIDSEEEPRYAKQRLDVDAWLGMPYRERRAYMWMNRLYYRNLYKIPRAWFTSATTKKSLITRAPWRRINLTSPEGSPRPMGLTANNWPPPEPIHKSFIGETRGHLVSETSDEKDYKEISQENLASYMSEEGDGESAGSNRDWEITHDSYCSSSGEGGRCTFKQFQEQVRWLWTNFPDTSLHIHLAFKRSEFGLDNETKRKAWARHISRLAYFLNTRAQLAGMGYTRYLNLFADKYELKQKNSTDRIAHVASDELEAILAGETIAPQAVESQVGEHRTGRWKFGLISFRQNYGDSNPETLGFEFRWSSLPYRDQIIAAVAKHLEEYTDPAAPPDLVLPVGKNKTQAYTAKQIEEAPLANLICPKDGLGGAMRRAAGLLLSAATVAKKINKSHWSGLPWAYDGEPARAVLRLWCMPFRALDPTDNWNYNVHLLPGVDKSQEALEAFNVAMQGSPKKAKAIGEVNIDDLKAQLLKLRKQTDPQEDLGDLDMEKFQQALLDAAEDQKNWMKTLGTLAQSKSEDEKKWKLQEAVAISNTVEAWLETQLKVWADKLGVGAIQE